MTPFHDIGPALHRAWRAAEQSPSRFARLAAAVLAEHPGSGPDTLAWLASELPVAALAALEPPAIASILLHEADGFAVTCEAWVGGSADITEPSVCGALSVVAGAVILKAHTFAADRDERPLALGVVAPRPPRLLSPGAVAELDHGLGFARFSLAPLTVVVVAGDRHGDPSRPPRRYLRAGVAFEPGPPPVSIHGALQSLSVRRTMKDAGLATHAHHLIAEQPAWVALHLVRHMAGLLPAPAFDAWLAGALPRHAELCARMGRELRRERARAAVRQVYDGAVGRPARELLAIALVAGGRRSILDLVAASAPPRAAAEVIDDVVERVRGLARQPARLPGAPNLLGVGLDEASFELLRARLGADSLDDAIEALASRLDLTPDDVATARDLGAAMASSPVLGALLDDEP